MVVSVFSFIFSVLTVVVVLSGVAVPTPDRTTPDDSLQAKAPGAISEIAGTPDVLISITDEIPTKGIKEFKGLISVSRTSTGGLPEEAISAFRQEARIIGANGVINFRLVVDSGPSPNRLFILYGNAVLVE